MHIILKLVSGETIEQTINGTSCVIGRSAKCDIVVPNEGMSRQHCQIEFIDGEYFVTDLGSTNGVMIDGHKLEAHKRTPYQTFLSLSFGAVNNATIEDDTSNTGASIPISPGARGHLPDPDAHNQTRLTKTRPMKEILKEEKSKAATKTSAEKTKESKPMAMNILAIIVLLGAVYWYMTKEEEPIDDSFTPAPKAKAPRPAKKQFDAF